MYIVPKIIVIIIIIMARAVGYLKRRCENSVR